MIKVIYNLQKKIYFKNRMFVLKLNLVKYTAEFYVLPFKY